MTGCSSEPGVAIMPIGMCILMNTVTVRNSGTGQRAGKSVY